MGTNRGTSERVCDVCNLPQKTLLQGSHEYSLTGYLKITTSPMWEPIPKATPLKYISHPGCASL